MNKAELIEAIANGSKLTERSGRALDATIEAVSKGLKKGDRISLSNPSADSARSLLTVLNDLLDTAQIQDGSLKIVHMPFSPAQTARRHLQPARCPRPGNRRLSLLHR